MNDENLVLTCCFTSNIKFGVYYIEIKGESLRKLYF
ncbi:hypothetical protein BMETH_2174_0 [methanotrophic bacterial endosymbiont of Bathymodiolus sp.]|nr:hypothetical protein BMETH_2174_0 [methanotrophic bacterial endosymbiont of Bathymodiolus sp.]